MGLFQQPVRFVGRQTRDLESPLAAALLSRIIEDTADLDGDIRLAIEVSGLLRLVTQTALGIYLRTKGATLDAE
jgi:hypothetical protein